MQLRGLVLRDPEVVQVVVESPIGMDARLDTELGRAVCDRVANARTVFLRRMLVGVRRAASLAKTAEGASDRAHVGDVDVAVDDERDEFTRELATQLIGGLPQILDRLRTGLGEQRGQLVLGQPPAVAGLGDRPGNGLPGDRPVTASTATAAWDERPVLCLDHIEHALGEPVGVQVLRMGTEPLRQRVAQWLQALTHLVRMRERMLGADVIAVRAQATEIRRPRRDQVRPRARQVRRNLDGDPRQQLLGDADQVDHVADRHGSRPPWRIDRWVRSQARPPIALGRLIGDICRLLSVVAAMRHEVLKNHLLEMTVLVMQLRERLERLDAIGGRLADADENPARERDPELAGGPNRRQPSRRVLGRRALVGSQARPGGLQHQPLRRGHLAESSQLLAAKDAEVGVGQDPGAQRLFADPHHVRHEVRVPEHASRSRTPG